MIANAATIRKATADDRPALQRMCASFIAAANLSTFGEMSAKSIDAMISACMEGGAVLVVDVDGAPVGMIVLAVVPVWFTGALYAHEMCWWVDESARGSGVGAELHATATEWARNAGVRGLMMDAIHGGTSELAESVYRSNGYRHIQTTWAKEF